MVSTRTAPETKHQHATEECVFSMDANIIIMDNGGGTSIHLRKGAFWADIVNKGQVVARIPASSASLSVINGTVMVDGKQFYPPVTSPTESSPSASPQLMLFVALATVVTLAALFGSKKISRPFR